MKQKPRGYAGIDHETIGSDILSLLDAVLMPESILGRDLCEKLRATDPARWYPIERLLEPLERLDARLGPDSLRRVGWSLYKLSHEAAIRASATSARSIVYGIDGMYHRANRGKQIGGWSVLDFKPGQATLEKTTPHHCMMEEGILEAALKTVGVSATIHQPRCIRRGADACHLVLSSHVNDHRWGSALTAQP